MSKGKELAVNTAGNGLQVYTDQSLMGVASSLSGSDIQIPSLMLMQSNSTFVADDDQLKPGYYIHSITKDIWGKQDKEPVELIFFDLFKTQVTTDVTNESKWVQTVAWSADMEAEPYEEVIDGLTIRKELVYNYMCFRAADVRSLEHPITSDRVHVATPIVVKFKGGSKKNGKRLNQVFQDYADFGAPSWATTFMLGARHETNKKNQKFWVYDFKKGNQASQEQQLAAGALYKKLQASKLTAQVVDHEGPKEKILNEEVPPPKAAQAKRAVKNFAEGIV